jgi:serine/threonine protein kinase
MPSSVSVQDAGVDTIGGYRLVRLLGFGARAEVFLGHAGTGDTGAPRVAAVKLYRPGVNRHSVDTELEALGRADSPHLLRLRDVATDRSGMPSAILQRLGADNLAQILVRRDELDAGEAVTILVPLVQAVAELHRVGVAHRTVRLSNVLFDEAGAPVLAGFGAASLIGACPGTGEHSLTAAKLSGDDAARTDLTDLVLLCRRVLDRTRPASRRSDDLAAFLEAAAGDADLDARGFPDELAARLFELADPLPVTLTPSRQSPQSPQSPQSSQASQSSQAPQASLAVPFPSHASAMPPALRSAVLRRGADPAAPTAGLAGRTPGRHRARHRRAPDAAEHSGWLSRFRFRRIRVRTPFWVAGAVGAAVLVGALALIPSAGPSRAVDEPVSSPLAAPQLSATPSALAAALVGDDPVEATRELLQARAGCLNARSTDCLSRVDQDDSAAMDNDTRIVASGHETAAAAPEREDLLFPIAGATLLERLGDGALVSIILPGSGTAPVTVLVIRTADGWRVRDVLVG